MKKIIAYTACVMLMFFIGYGTGAAVRHAALDCSGNCRCQGGACNCYSANDGKCVCQECTCKDGNKMLPKETDCCHK